MKKHFCSSLKYIIIFELTQSWPKTHLVSKEQLYIGSHAAKLQTQSGSKPVLGVGTRAGARLGVCLSVRLFVCLRFFSPFFSRYVSTNITYYKSPFFEMIDIEIFMPYRSEFNRYLILTSSLVGKSNSFSLNGRKGK